jgi:hypothetical protein
MGGGPGHLFPLVPFFLQTYVVTCARREAAGNCPHLTAHPCQRRSATSASDAPRRAIIGGVNWSRAYALTSIADMNFVRRLLILPTPLLGPGLWATVETKSEMRFSLTGDTTSRYHARKSGLP